MAGGGWEVDWGGKLKKKKKQKKNILLKCWLKTMILCRVKGDTTTENISVIWRAGSKKDHQSLNR